MIGKTALLIGELLVVILRVVWAIASMIFQTFLPPKEADVRGKVVLITGAAQGIGKSLAEKYGQLGAIIVSVDNNEEANMQTTKQLKNQGIKIYPYTCDVTNREEVFAVSKRVESEVGLVEVLVLNAGILINKSIEQHEEQDVRKIFDVNVISQFWAYLKQMKKNKYGHVVSISSLAGLKGVGFVSAYSASKHAITGLMESVAQEVQENNLEIKLTTVYPNFVRTPMSENSKIRFRGVLDKLSPEDAATAIITAQRRGYGAVTIPRTLRTPLILLRLLPPSASTAIDEFMQMGFYRSRTTKGIET